MVKIDYIIIFKQICLIKALERYNQGIGKRAND